jgi:hypothetical protein
MMRGGLGRAVPRLLLLVAVAIPLTVGSIWGLELGLLAFGGVVLAGTIALLWQSLLGLTGQSALSVEEALTLAAPTVEEEQKRAVLRMLKDLEYERTVGKISEQDFRELSTKYRALAKELIVAVDEGLTEHRRRAEQILEKRLKRAEKSPKNKRIRKANEPKKSVEPELNSERESEPPDTFKRCPACTTDNDNDARFCKGCGGELEASP